MINVLLITFLITLLYVAIANRLRTFINILIFQGILLFGVSFIQLIHINLINLIFILLETIIFKSIVVPKFLSYIIKRNNITRETEPFLPNFFSLIIITAIIIATIALSYNLPGLFDKKIYFVAALSALFSGLYIIATRKKIITHIMGYLIIENAVFVFSVAIGAEMPMLINLGILLDIFVSILILGIFVNKIGDVIKDVDINKLQNIKD